MRLHQGASKNLIALKQALNPNLKGHLASNTSGTRFPKPFFNDN